MKKIEPYSYLVGKVTNIKRGSYIPKKGYQFILNLLVEGKRKSLNSVLPVITYQKQIDFYDIKVEDFLSVLGDLIVTGTDKDPVISVFAKKIKKIEEAEHKEIISNKEDNNKIVLIGYVSRFPVIIKRMNGKGSYMKVTVAIEKKDQTFDLIPCTCTLNEQNSSTLIVGNKVCIVGRLESRNRTKGKSSIVKTVYEISIKHSARYKL